MGEENQKKERTGVVLPNLPEDVVNKALVPAATEFGKKIVPAGKELGSFVNKIVVNALHPIELMIWGYDNIKKWLTNDLTCRLKDIPAEKIKSPDPRVAVPIIDALRYAGSNETIRDMFANLLASAMNTDLSDHVHPAFVELVKQLDVMDAKILEYLFKNYQSAYINIRETDEKGYRVRSRYFGMMWLEVGSPDALRYNVSIENLMRLELIHSPSGYIADKPHYVFLEEHNAIKQLLQSFDKDHKPEFEHRYFEVTRLGHSFCSIACASVAAPP